MSGPPPSPPGSSDLTSPTRGGLPGPYPSPNPNFITFDSLSDSSPGQALTTTAASRSLWSAPLPPDNPHLLDSRCCTAPAPAPAPTPAGAHRSPELPPAPLLHLLPAAAPRGPGVPSLGQGLLHARGARGPDTGQARLLLHTWRLLLLFLLLIVLLIRFLLILLLLG